MAGEMESQLAELEGVAHVKANPLTGSVLVCSMLRSLATIRSLP